MGSDERWKEAEWFVVSSAIYTTYRGVKDMDFKAIQTQVQIPAMLPDNYVTWLR